MRRLGVLVAAACLLIFSTSAFAQDDSHGEFSGGWRYYHATIHSLVGTVQLTRPKNFQKGWYGDVAVNASEKFALVGEAGGTYDKDHFSQTTGPVSFDESSNIHVYTFMGGVRIRAPQNEHIVPFGQVLFGGERDTSSDQYSVTFLPNTPSAIPRKNTSGNAALALDSGVTMMVGFVGVRASVGYVRMFSAADADAFRFSLGAAFRF